ncbi:MAG: 4'-phosphopantetheinyl transferase EntD [Salibacteraceae bacterium]|mgnify:CR=1 FL=1|jgi:4'-phosphopantetheinyl transferase EntD|tara:strand:- start:657 stop:1259 length:603 start_codon:yes stop_codon:yes gene_type:complete
MPLLRHVFLDNQTQIIVWRIEEDFMEYQLIPDLCNNKNASRRLEKMAIRYVLDNFFDQLELSYDVQGKPALTKSDKFISISHSNLNLVVGIGENDLGLDIELISDKAVNISRKFIHKNDFLITDSMNENYHKTLIWSAKEALFKKYSQKEHLIFKQQIAIETIDENSRVLNSKVEFTDGTAIREFLSYSLIEDFILVHSN